MGGWEHEQMAGWVNRETDLVLESPVFNVFFPLKPGSENNNFFGPMTGT